MKMQLQFTKNRPYLLYIKLGGGGKLEPDLNASRLQSSHNDIHCIQDRTTGIGILQCWI